MLVVIAQLRNFTVNKKSYDSGKSQKKEKNLRVNYFIAKTLSMLKS